MMLMIIIHTISKKQCFIVEQLRNSEQLSAKDQSFTKLLMATYFVLSITPIQYVLFTSMLS